MTGQSLFYMEDGDLKHKVLAIAEEEGAERASYALKILQSEGQLKIASTGKDPDTGRHITSEYEVEGPVAIFTTTTAIDVDEELLNRCLVLTVDEENKQTTSIYFGQRDQMTPQGISEGKKRERILRRQQNAQRLLKPVVVANPYAPFLTFPSHRVRLRRDHKKYLELMSTIALVHQHQRELKTMMTAGGALQYIEVALSDIDLANHLMEQVLGRSLDELAPQTRKVLDKISALVLDLAKADGIEAHEVRFTRRQARDHIGMSASQLHLHLGRLVELEYFTCERQVRGRSTEYALIWAGQRDGQPTLAGLTSSAEAKRKYDAANSGASTSNSGPIRPLFAPNSGPIRGATIAEMLHGKALSGASAEQVAGKALLRDVSLPPSHSYARQASEMKNGVQSGKR